ncbi:hypothetical protein SLEP1_g11755 [Rubroshorea leprosula]|nr:hypothetical protein SLEP1_g11755 [Rubroshorea leprosula]
MAASHIIFCPYTSIRGPLGCQESYQRKIVSPLPTICFMRGLAYVLSFRTFLPLQVVSAGIPTNQKLFSFNKYVCTHATQIEPAFVNSSQINHKMQATFQLCKGFKPNPPSIFG